MKSKKGASFERELAGILSDWWIGKKNSGETLFWRTSNSGGRATVRGKKGKGTRGHCGDIGATDSTGEPLMKLVTLEIKRGYSKYTIFDLVDKSSKAALQEWESWYQQVTEAQQRSGSFSWMIISRRDQRNSIVFFPKNLMSQFREEKLLDYGLPVPFGYLLIYPRTKVGNRTIGCKGKEQIYFMRLEHFLERVTPAAILKIVERLKL